MTFFCKGDDLLAGGAQPRRALLKAAPHLGCDLSGYEEFSKSVADETDDNRHCMLAFTPLPNGQVDLRVGLSPNPQMHEPVVAQVPSPTRPDTDQPYYVEPTIPIADISSGTQSPQ